MATFSGKIARIRFRNPQNGYTVLSVTPDERYTDRADSYGKVAVVGSLPELHAEQYCVFEGEWGEDARYGPQFQAISVESAAIEDSEESISGTIERVTYHNPETGYSVLRVAPRQAIPGAMNPDGQTITVVGLLPELNIGEDAQFSGRWVDNATYGRQFDARTVVPLGARSEDGVKRYLIDNVRGVGEVTAEKIFKHFGGLTLEILDADPRRIYDVPELKRQIAENVIETWGKNRQERSILVQLQGFGLTGLMARKIYRHYEGMTLAVLREDPYKLAEDIEGIGFKRADQIARGMGLPLDSPARLRAGLSYALEQIASDGHTYAPRDFLISRTADLLGVNQPEQISALLDQQIMQQALIAEPLLLDGARVEAIYLPIYHRAEQFVARQLRLMEETPSKIIFRMKGRDWPTLLDTLARENSVELSEAQQSAVQAALTNKVSVLTGGPGTGKTTTLQMVIHALEREGFTLALASPTGRAAKRLNEATARDDAKTIHRLLEFSAQFGGFERDEDNPLDVDFVILDETSMLDLLLFYSLLRALRPTTHLLLVGDVDQLPSVGAGNVLRDVIASGQAHVTRLTQIFRQSQQSQIIVNAHRINQGEMPHTRNPEGSDFYFFNIETPDEAAEMVVDVVTQRLPSKFGFDPRAQVQAIAPMYRGPIGVDALNAALQKVLNPANAGTAHGYINGQLYRMGDRIMQTKNNYELDVFNGDMGTIRGMELESNVPGRPQISMLRVEVDGRLLTYEDEALEQIILAYCISTHRSQGSEYPVIVMPVMTQHYMMLQRNLLYTAITRAKKMVVLVGTRKAIAMAVNNNKVAERFSGLLPRLLG